MYPPMFTLFIVSLWGRGAVTEMIFHQRLVISRLQYEERFEVSLSKTIRAGVAQIGGRKGLKNLTSRGSRPLIGTKKPMR